MKLNVAVDKGSGPPLVLLHGWPQHAGMWRDVIPALSERFRCLALDLRGLGASPAPRDGYDKPTLAADVLETLDSLGVTKARFMGHDWGAVVTWIITRDHPERVEKAMILSIPPPWDGTPDPRKLVGIAHMPFMASPLGERFGADLGKLIMTGSGLSSERAEEYVAPMRNEPDRAHAASLYYRTFLLRELPGGLRAAGKPDGVQVTALGGARDPVCRFSRGLEKVPGAGHFLPEEKPDVVIDRALAFF